MNEPDAIWHIKRGRPRKLEIEEYMKLNTIFKTSLTAGELKYRRAKGAYLINSYSPKIDSIIQGIVLSLELPFEFKHLPLLMTTQEAAKQMLISEMELIVFAIIISKNKIAECNLNIEELVKLCFFHTKLILESDLELTHLIRDRLKDEISNFEDKLASIYGTEKISLRKINKWGRRFNGWNIVTINYSYYVDNIILKAPPYKLLEKADKNSQNKGSEIKTEKEKKGAPRKKPFEEVQKVESSSQSLMILCMQVLEKEALEPMEDSEEGLWCPKEDTEYGLEKIDNP